MAQDQILSELPHDATGRPIVPSRDLVYHWDGTHWYAREVLWSRVRLCWIVEDIPARPADCYLDLSDARLRWPEAPRPARL